MPVQINTHNISSSPEANAVTLAVSQSGLDITISGGSFTVAQQGYTLAESTFTHTVNPLAVELVGWLVVEISTGEALLFVDEIPAGEFEYDFWGSPYKPLNRLFSVRVAGGAITLDDAICALYRITNEEVQP